MTPLHFKHPEGLILKPLYAGTVSSRGWISQKEESLGINLQKCGLFSRGTNRHRKLPSIPLNVLQMLSQDRFTPHPHSEQNHCWVHPIPVHPSSSQWSSHWNFTVQILCTPASHLSLVCCSLSKAPRLMWVYKHQDKLYRSNLFKMRHLYSALSWGSLPATQARDFFSVSWAGSFCWELQELISSWVYFNLGQVTSTLQSFSSQTHLSAVDY